MHDYYTLAMLKLRLLILVLIGLALTASSYAQSRTDARLDSIAKKIGYYARKNPSELMFVHVDKTIYTNNEEIWFTAYIVNCPPAELAKHQVLSVALVKDDDNAIVTTEKFVSAGRLAFGSLTIPDSAAAGDYTFIAYTNRKINGKPAAFFSQPITIKTATQQAFNLIARVDTLNDDATGIHVTLRGQTPDGALANATVNYGMGVNRQTRINGRGKTDVNGRYEIIVPRKAINPNQHILEIIVKRGTETKALKLFMPMPRQAHQLKFYPEGGHLVAGMLNRIAFEAKNAGGAPLKATAVLFKDKKIIDTIATDSYGMGVFNLQPAATKKYYVKLLSPQNVDTAYNLPANVAAGLTLQMTNALVNDTLRFAINTLQAQKIYLLVQNYNQVYATVPVDLVPGRRSVMVDLTQMPRGLNSVTLLDSLYRPCAERLFFAHYEQKPGISINTDKAEYGLRKKVNLTLRLKSNTGKPSNGIVSVACVQDNRFDIKKDNNIENFVYLRSAIENLPLKDNYLGFTSLDRQYLNELLLVRGWSKYKWVDMIKATPVDTIQKQDSVTFMASVTKNGKPPKKPVSLIMMRDSSANFSVLKADANANTEIENALLVARYGKKIRLAVSGKTSEYVIEMPDPYKAQNTMLARQIEPNYYSEPPAEVDTRELILKGMEKATHLREVKIIARKDNYVRFAANANKCGDYVCSYQVLNCTNHRYDMANRPPAQGEMVYLKGKGFEQYFGCADGDVKIGMIAIKGIYEAKEFYGADYTLINPTEPDYLSTICWKHAVNVNSEIDTKFSFYTTDITGKYRIVVQGLTDDDVVYSEQVITIKKQLP